MRKVALLSVGLLVAIGAWAVGDQPPYKTAAASESTPVVVRPGRYDYAPTVMVKAGKYHVWWCGSSRPGGGDTIYHVLLTDAELRKGVSMTDDAEAVFSNSGSEGKFDGRHTCDPSVITVGGRYYLYYGGISASKVDKSDIKLATKMGVAESSDGVHWDRMEGGRPVLEPRALRDQDTNKYGLGQPSVVFVDGNYYILYTNSVGPDGPGLYVIRSKTPLVKEPFDIWTRDKGFVPGSRQDMKLGDRLAHAFSADWAYIADKDVFVVASRKGDGADVQLAFFERTSLKRVGEFDLGLHGSETSPQPGLARDENGWLYASTKTGGALSFFLFRSAGGKRPQSWDIWANEITLQ
jgi:hypothetical protein